MFPSSRDRDCALGLSSSDDEAERLVVTENGVLHEGTGLEGRQPEDIFRGIAAGQ